MRQKKTYELKTWPAFFQLTWVGEKTFEYRKDDRGFQVGDVLRLREWDPRTKRYTLRVMSVLVTLIVRGEDVPGMPSGYVVMQTEAVESAMTVRVPNSCPHYHVD